MARKKIVAEAKKPDIVVTSVEASLNWIKANPKPFCMGGAVVIALVGLFFGFRLYESRKDERVQYLLSQGLRSYQEYALAGQQDSLTKAESTFRELLREKPKGADDIARLYLGKISRAQNKVEEARTYYAQVAQGAADPLIKKFASSALQELGGSK
jgi:predicted negative regulator of RcsB-dependent stress response